DDLDDLLAGLFAARMKMDLSEFSLVQREWLRRHACQQKESIAGGSVRSLTLAPADLGLARAPCRVQGGDFLAPGPGVDGPAGGGMGRGVEGVPAFLGGPGARGAGIDPESLEAVYLVGGSSKLPPVAEMIAARLPRARLVMTDKPFTATAMGAAIHSAGEVAL